MSNCIRRVLVNRLARSLGKGNEIEQSLYKRLEVKSLKKTDPQLGFVLKIDNESETQKAELQKLVQQNPRDDIIESCTQNEQNELRIGVNQQVFKKSILDSIVKNGPFYNKDDIEIQKKKVVVEFSSPNIAKPFHVGHLHSTVLGNIIANLYKLYGHDVIRLNYLGDYGVQLVLLYLGYLRYGNEEELKKNPLNHLYQVYVEIHACIEKEANDGDGRKSPIYMEAKELFTQIENGTASEQYEALSTRLGDISRTECQKMYERLGIEFDEYHSESMYKDKAVEFLNTLKQQNLLKYRDGMGCLATDNNGEEDLIAIQKSDGTSLYLTRDIVAAMDRYEKYKFDIMHYVVSKDQYTHFRFLHRCLQTLQPEVWQNRKLDDLHISFGRIIGISTRKGQTVFLEEVLEQAKELIITKLKSTQTTKVDESEYSQVAERLALSSIIVQYTSKKRRMSYSFDWDKFVNMDSGSGVALQYCHARLYSLEKEFNTGKIDTIDSSLLIEQPAIALISHLAGYPDVLRKSVETLEPHRLVQYLLQLSNISSKAYGKIRLKDENASLVEARLGLFNCARETVAHGLRILGIEPLNEL